ncbi:MAG: hypothetical protein MUF58_08010 [Arcicella sp.]|jgi:hypothetical protein|nr:hypothetical protein [Arcicella sp.]
MKKHIINTFILISLVQPVWGQTARLDSIFTSDGLVLANVKKIAPDVIEYSFPDEEVVTAIYKNTVKKIRFKSGRVQSFSEATSLNEVTSVYDYEKVNLTRVEGEIKGLFKIDEIASKAVGTTVLSNITTVKERAFRKLKIQAAMLGGNLIYMLDQSTVGNQAGGYYQSGKSTETILSGIVYSNKLPNFEDFKMLTKGKKQFSVYQKNYVGRNSTDIEETDTYVKEIKIEDIYEENKFIYLKVKGYENYTLRVISFTNDNITIGWRDKDRIYNMYLAP